MAGRHDSPHTVEELDTVLAVVTEVLEA